MSRKVEQSKVYAKWILTSRMSCNNCKKRPGEYANKRWCKKCSKSHKAELITMIPIEVFMFYVLPFLSYMDILNMSAVSKDMNHYFNENGMWKEFHMGIKCVRGKRKILKDLSWKKAPPNPTMNWTINDMALNLTRLLIKNESQIPMVIYSVKNKHGGGRKIGVGPLLMPGQSEYITTYPNNRFICYPTDEWLFKNPVSNVGFTFIINILEIITVNEIPCFVRNIEQPKKMNPIKGYNKKYANHKKEFIRLSVDPAIMAKKVKKNKIAYKQTQKELRYLYCRARVLERSAADLRRHEASYGMTQNVLLEGSGSRWAND